MNNNINIKCKLSDLTLQQQDKLLSLLYQIEYQADYKNKTISNTINILQDNLCNVRGDLKI